MEIRRKFQIGLGIVLLISGLAANSSFWGVGIFMILVGVFNFCPSCSNGSCKVETKQPEEK